MEIPCFVLSSSFVDRHLRAQVSETLLSVLWGQYPEVELLDYMVILSFFFRNHHTVFLNNYHTVYIPKSAQRFQKQFVFLMLTMYLQCRYYSNNLFVGSLEFLYIKSSHLWIINIIWQWSWISTVWQWKANMYYSYMH